MLELKTAPEALLGPLMADFRHKSDHIEDLSPGCELVGIYEDAELVGYFALMSYEDGDLEIQQGYLNPGVRHRKLEYNSMRLLQATARKAGLKRIILKASRSLGAYQRFMNNLGFKPESIIFSKVI